MTLRERIMEAAGGRPPVKPASPPVALGLKNLRGCSGCRKKMLAKMKAKRAKDESAGDKEGEG